MRAIIKVDMDNDAFQENNGDELARILGDLAIKCCGYHLTEDFWEQITDSNGNAVGKLTIKE